MRKPYRPFPGRKFTAAIIFVAGIIPSLHAQEIIEGLVRIKVSEALASRLEAKTITRNQAGVIVTGIPSLDERNTQFKVRAMQRVFPHAGRNESRHRRYGLHLWYEVRANRSIHIPDMLRAYRSEHDVLKAEPVYKKAVIGRGQKNFGPRVIDRIAPPPAVLPNASNDPMLGRQWHFHNTGQSGGTPGADINLFDAWKLETGSKNVIVAVIDEGIQTNHPDLAANMWVNAAEIPGNNTDDDHNGYIDDIHGYNFVQHTAKITAGSHGTHVAGTLAAVTNNGRGVAGVAGGSGRGDGVRLMSCAVFHADSTADGFAQAYVYSADNGAVISQNSWGYLMPGIYEEVVLDAIDYFIAEAGKDVNGNQIGPMNGGIVIFSAGNDSAEDHYYPAAFEQVVAVASSTHRDIKARYSNYGSWVDITGPGGETYDGNREGVLSTLPDNQYGSFMGTSMACPHVSGVAGLILARFGGAGFRPETLRQRLLHSVANIDALNPSFAGKLGTGRINAALALGHSDPSPPDAVTDLKVTDNRIGEITLAWTSPPDDNDFVSAYDLRFSTAPITEENFLQATQADSVPVPGPPGTQETCTLRNLPGDVVFYFALRSVDFEGNISALSNVVKEKSSAAPAIVVVPSSLTENLKTAGQSVKSFIIRNDGKGPLVFAVTERLQDKDFASATPAQGTILPGKATSITVTFDAAALLQGTYHQELIITTNDPLKNEVRVPLTLTVANNGAPIASITPTVLDFGTVQAGTSRSRALKISNAGSEPLIVSKITTGNPNFSAGFSKKVSVPSFQQVEILVYYSPSRPGHSSGEILVHTNDPARRVLRVAVKGQALDKPPVAITPSRFEETLERGTMVTRTMTLKNNGTRDRAFKIEIADPVVAGTTAYITGRATERATARIYDSVPQKLAALRSKHEAILNETRGDVKKLITAIGNEPDTNASQGRKSTNNEQLTREYRTGFEDFALGPTGNQHGWYATQHWAIADKNPDRGLRHFQGASTASGSGDKFALSPYLFASDEWDQYPRYTSASMRVNLDRAKGTTWQVVPQDPWSYVATRIRFNADGSAEAMTINNDYAYEWKKLPVALPPGYFDLTVELNNLGNDTTSFAVYSLYINNEYVFSGTSLCSGIGQVAFASPMETSGPVLDIDELRIIADEHIPPFIRPNPAAGVVGAGQSANIGLVFDATVMKYGTYHSAVVVHMDEDDSLSAPASLTVTGNPSVESNTYFIQLEVDKNESAGTTIVLTNTGGRPVGYELAMESPVPGLTISPSTGTLPVRGNALIDVGYRGDPGVYETWLVLKTDIEELPHQKIWLEVTAFDSGAVFRAPAEAEFDIMAGEISARSVRITNAGVNTVTFLADSAYLPDWLGIDPLKATVSKAPVNLNLIFDARALSAGTRQAKVSFKTNDINRRTHEMLVTVNVSPDTVRGGKILREVWTGIPGKELSAIPLHREPDSSTFISSFESPQNTADNYGSRVRGYVQAPSSGYYTFWIASNDNSVLWLSADENEMNKRRIAYVNGYTSRQQWSKYPSQKSKPVYLEADKKYFIEALHKEGTGADHLAVGWQMADKTYERPIPGVRLFPYGSEKRNEAPVVKILAPAAGAPFTAPATIHLRAEAHDDDGSVVKVEFFNGTARLGTDISAPYTCTWTGAPAGSHEIVVKATDNLGDTDTATVKIQVREGLACADAGSITREQWNNVPGTRISSIPFAEEPSLTEPLTLFEGPSNVGDNYGARIRGYLCVPVSGAYTFWISGNDNSELWLSTDFDPANRKKIAYVSGYTNARQWTKYPSQQSASIQLVAGETYYIEALHKEGAGADNVAVGWRLPDGSFERPIPGSRLIPVTTIMSDGCAASGFITREYWTGISGNVVSAVPVDSPPQGVETLTSFEGPQNAGTNYGARIRGYICPPQTGNYYLWISSNDQSELWLSTDDRPGNKRRIALVNGATAVREWNKYTSQKSAAIRLEKGKKYYVEALHKQGVGMDHLAVGWELPDGMMERPIAGKRLSPYVVPGMASAELMPQANLLIQERGEEEGPPMLHAYPNPLSDGTLNISLENVPLTGNTPRDIEIRQATGAVVYRRREVCSDCITSIDVRGMLSSGVYILQVKIQGRIFVEKLVVP